MAAAAWSVSPSRRIPAMSVAQQLRRAVELSGGVGADVRRVGQRRLRSRVRAEIGRPRQPGDRADDVAASQGAMRAVLDSGGDVLVRRESRLGEVMAAPFGLIREQLGQAQMRLRAVPRASNARPRPT